MFQGQSESFPSFLFLFVLGAAAWRGRKEAMAAQEVRQLCPCPGTGFTPKITLRKGLVARKKRLI